MKNLLTLAVVTLALAAPAFAQPRPSQSGRVAPTDTADRPQIDIEAYTIDLTIIPDEHAIRGIADVQFKQLDRKNFATFDLDRRLHVSAVTLGNEPVRFRQFDLDSTFEADLGGQPFSGSP